MSIFNQKSYLALNQTVIANGFCVGCGACAVPEQSPFEIFMNEYGQYESRLSHTNTYPIIETNYEKICPFGSIAPNEDELAKKHFSNNCQHNTQIGYYKKLYAGHVTEGEFRKQGSSGGMGTWILNELFSKGLVDHVIHVKSENSEDEPNKLPFKYQISSNSKEIQQGGKSRYYPIELSEVIKIVRNKPGRFAIIGLPCFIKSIRLLQTQDHIIEKRIKYCIGLICGHLKSAHYAESLAWQMGISPKELKSIDFRVKETSAPANLYSTYAKGIYSEKIIQTNKLFGADWGAGAFKYKSCDFCDDVFAETADLVLGDAWLPEYIQDSYGTNIIVTRNNDIHQLILNAQHEGRININEISTEKAIKSQSAGLRHRKIGIADRLDFEKNTSHWLPIKRSTVLNQKKQNQEKEKEKDKDKQILRSKLRDLSHTSFKQAKEKNNIKIYINNMKPVYSQYKKIGTKFTERLRGKIKNYILRALRLIGY